MRPSLTEPYRILGDVSDKAELSRSLRSKFQDEIYKRLGEGKGKFYPIN